MKRFALLLSVSLVLSACASPQFIPDELRMLKPACVAGHWEVCADIGHEVRRAEAEAGYLSRAR